MGLAASQARLLTITSRKSRAQFENMRFSHQKLALSRSLTEISNEYQRSLEQTKLYYDFYGINSTETPLTYNLLMSPSSINDYTPTLISDSDGRIVLSAPYAAAALAAGVPPEGLGCAPSTLMRNAFIQNLAAQGVITLGTADAICAVDYNQGAGLGGDNLVNTITTTGDYEQLMDLLNGGSNTAGIDLTYANIHEDVSVMFEAISGGNKSYTSYTSDGNRQLDSTGSDASTALAEITLADLLSGDQHIYLGKEGGENNNPNIGLLYEAVNNVISQLGSALGSLVEGAGDAVAYANDQMNTYCWGGSYFDPTTGMYTGEYSSPEAFKRIDAGGSDFGFVGFGDMSDSEVARGSLHVSGEYLMICDAKGDSGFLHDDPNNQATVDLSAFAQGWFTYFMQYMQGLGSAASNMLDVKWNEPKEKSTFASADNLGDYQFTFTTEFVSDSESLISNFYDTLFNQICVNGWTENDQVAKDSGYLKEMLQNGMMFVTSMSDDYYFYQNNYSTNTFIKEVSDDAAIAAAESKYTTEKSRINAKEQEIDLKMKNLDTEISSLETEYEAVKKVIQGNVSKSFTRYDS